MRKDHRRHGDAQRVFHRVRRDVAQVDEHAEAIHLANDLFAKPRQAAVRRLVGGRVGPGEIRGMGQRHVLRAEDVQHAQRRQRVVDRVAALNANQRSDTFGLERALDVRGCVSDLERLGPPHGHAMDDVDLLEGCPHGFIALHARRHIDRPELAADAALPQTRNVGHQFRHRLRNVGFGEDRGPDRARAAPTDSRCVRRRAASACAVRERERRSPAPRRQCRSTSQGGSQNQ